MKTLYLVRHAKSSWTFDLPDHDRPVGKRGRKDVMKMGQYLSKHQPPPEIIISSSASRAFYTALYLCDFLGVEEDKILLSQQLFHASRDQILDVISQAPTCNILAVFGHNPGITSISNHLSGAYIDNIPTCGIVGIEFDVSSWSEIRSAKGQVTFTYFPKELL